MMVVPDGKEALVALAIATELSFRSGGRRAQNTAVVTSRMGTKQASCIATYCSPIRERWQKRSVFFESHLLESNMKYLKATASTGGIRSDSTDLQEV